MYGWLEELEGESICWDNDFELNTELTLVLLLLLDKHLPESFVNILLHQ